MPTLSLFELASLAYRRGYLDLRCLLDTIYEAGQIGEGARAPEFWLAPGRLSAEQMEALLSDPQVSGVVEELGSQDDLESLALPPSSAGSGHITVNLSEGLENLVVAMSPPAARPAATRPPPLPSLPPLPPQNTPPPPQTSLKPPPNDNIDRFRSIGVLGVGGMGRVLEFEDTRLGRRVAVKSLRPDLPEKSMPARLLEREARITGSLEHPNIVPVYDGGKDPSLGPYYVMRVLKQPTLLDVLSRLRKADVAALAEYTLGKLLRTFIQICHAVDYAHSRGVIHCDLKPANVLVGSYGEVLVVDWGFAQHIGEEPPVRGGTPGYMAPEQLDPRPEQLDARTDVFALGSMLYELLALRRAFPSPSVDAMLAAISRGEPPMPLPQPPSAVAVGRAVPAELDEVCLRALAPDPAGRFASARALAESIELFLEGTKEKERRLARAAEMTEQGDALASSYFEMLASHPERVEELTGLQASIEPWHDSERKQELWDTEDRHAVLDALGVRTFQAAVSAYEHALEEHPGYAAARGGLARLYMSELERARQRRDQFNRIYFEGLVNQHDDGSLSGRLTQTGTLAIDCVPPGALAEIHFLHEQGRRLVSMSELPPEATPCTISPLEPGHYLVVVDDPGGKPVRVPALVRPDAATRLRLDLREARQIQPGEVFIPGGPALLGGHESSRFGRQPVEIDVPSFFLSGSPVTFADYLEFLAAFFAADPEGAAGWLPSTADGSPYWEWDGSDFIPAQIARWGDSLVSLLCLPTIGVDLRGAMAYAAWKSHQTGLAYRLPTEAEWEKAARGTDGRRYPWGDHFDPSFCKMRQSRRGPPEPEPCGSFAHDVSPYGVADMAGGVAEWVLPDETSEPPPSSSLVFSRGGAWCDWDGDCHAAARRAYWAGDRSERVGFRLARRPAPAR